MKKILFIAIVLLLAAGALLAMLIIKAPKTPSGKITVVTTLFPLYNFAKNIGQDKVVVSLLLAPGMEAHSFEPKPSDIAKINQADIFIFTGKFMEPWAQDIVQGVNNKNLVIVDSSKGIKLLASSFHDKDEPAGAPDPHIWLDFANTKIMIDNITKALTQKDPENADFYQANAQTFRQQIIKLDHEYQIALRHCNSKEIIYGGHYAFNYLAQRYDLTYTAAHGISPNAAPTVQDLINLVEQIKRDHIKYVFYEELTSPKIAQTIAQETGTQMLLLNAAHNVSKEDFENNVSFVSIMRDNLNNLKIGLECAK